MITLLLALVIAGPGPLWFVWAPDGAPPATTGVATCVGPDAEPQWCKVEGRGRVEIEGEVVQYGVWLPEGRRGP